jgi:hypothetical protein
VWEITSPVRALVFPVTESLGTYKDLGKFLKRVLGPRRVLA